ncbi:MAG: CPBP family intramembrane metalloprotease [Proteobacteria bacterium]|nr:CPBP family intramembrane metalloprotease [Pseudomonadota bacterium]
MRFVVAPLLCIALLAAVYAPVFAAVSMLRPALPWIPPLIILGTLALALGLMRLLAARAHLDTRSFGFRSCTRHDLLVATGLGIALGAILQYAVAQSPSHAPLDFSKLPIVLLLTYFGMLAPIQEEVIFRGLLQSTFGRLSTKPIASTNSVWTVLFCALLFGVVHFELSVATAGAAFVLGLVAGELRRRSGSLVPAIVLHALCNGWGIVGFSLSKAAIKG